MLDMNPTPRTPYLFAGLPLTILGMTFVAIGAAGQPAFLYTACGLLVPGAVLLLCGWRAWRRAR
jgi:hypothetical protein